MAVTLEMVRRAQRQAQLEDETVRRLADIFDALSDPTRLRILHALSLKEAPVCDIAENLAISESAVSHQLRRLRDLRLVKPRRAGKHIYYSLDDHHVVRLIADGLEHALEDQ